MAYTPQLVDIASFRKPLSMSWNGSLNFPISGGGHAIKTNPTNISFSKTGAYALSFWIKFDADDDVYRQIILLGALSSAGYRIVKDRANGRNVICLQEVSSNFTADRWYYPVDFDITQWHHITIQWQGNSATSVTSYCYINARQFTTKSNSITWNNAVAVSTPLVFGYDWADHTMGANINDMAFFNKLLSASQIFDIYNKRSFPDPVGLWRGDSAGNNIIIDEIGENDLAIYNSITFQEVDQSY